MANGNGNFWQDYVLGYEPQAAYYSAAPFGTGASAASPFGGGFSPASQSYWSGQYGTVMNQYLGEAGRAMRRGEEPTQSFTGGSTARFAPSARRMY